MIVQILNETINLYEKNVVEVVNDANQKLEALLNTLNLGTKINEIEVSNEDIKELPSVNVVKKNLDVSLSSNAVIERDRHVDDRQYKSTVAYKSLHDIEIMQQNMLTSEERLAILIYKTSYYRAINPVISYARKNNIPNEKLFSDQNVQNMIEKAYLEMVEKSKKEKEYEETGIKELDDIFGKYAQNLGIPPLEEYKQLIINSIPLIEKAMNKIVLPEDIVVYRGIPSNSDSFLKFPNQFLSTSLSPVVAREFLERDIEGAEAQIKAFYKITLPAGSNALFFTREILTGNLSKENQDYIHFDEQREVLIDSNLFDFEEIDRTIFSGRDWIDNYRTEEMAVEYIELIAHPKKFANEETNEIAKLN